MTNSSKGITILMRHGYTDYKQGNVPVSIDEANDLNEKGIEAVERSSHEIAEILQDSKLVTLYTSPMGRAIHTAKILKQHLEARIPEVRLISAVELQEVHNFSWALFYESVLCSGVEAGKQPTDHWFALDPFREKTPELLRTLPEHLRAFIQNVETADEAQIRMRGFLRATEEVAGDKVYVTHDGLLCGLLQDLSDNTVFTCTRSHYFEITPCDTEVGIRIGRNNIGYCST